MYATAGRSRRYARPGRWRLWLRWPVPSERAARVQRRNRYVALVVGQGRAPLAGRARAGGDRPAAVVSRTHAAPLSRGPERPGRGFAAQARGVVAASKGFSGAQGLEINDGVMLSIA